MIFLAMAGFVGVLAVSLGDHAQNGLFFRTEWISAAAAALAASFLLTVLIRPLDCGFQLICLALMGLQVLVGGLGFLFHVRAGPGRRIGVGLGQPDLRAAAVRTTSIRQPGPPRSNRPLGDRR